MQHTNPERMHTFIDHIEPDGTPDPTSIEADILSIAAMTIELADIKRRPRYPSGRRENNAEHSLMVAAASYSIISRYFPDQNPALGAAMGIVHDTPELKDGDVATFILNDKGLAAKQAAEQAAVPEIATRLGKPLGSLLIRYEAQKEPEAITVGVIDKLVVVGVDILGLGERVMRQDYDIHSPEQLAANAVRLQKRYRARFPDPNLQPILAARDLLVERFHKKFAAGCLLDERSGQP